MGYIKVAHREILRQLDNILFFPTGWNKFVEKQTISHNLIIKSSKNSCYCTYCHNTFISTKKVNEKAKCPYCHNKYLIKRSNLKHYEFKDYLSILDKVNSTLIVRYFELVTDVDKNHNTTSSVVEFGREIPNKTNNRTIYINDRVSKCQGCIYISHSNYCNEKKWREYTRNYSLIDYSIPFPNNIKKVLKDTPYKHSEIWNIVKHSPFYLDLVKLIQDTSEIPKIEMLAKLKLYNLALNAYWCNSKGTFQSIFGVPKTFYAFMKRNNITYKQLEILRLLQEQNIDKIHYLETFITDYYYYKYEIDTLKEIADYVGINRFIKYSKMLHHKIDIHIYKDYLRFAKLLGLDLKNKRYAFPKNLKESHDNLEKQYEIHNKKIVNQAILRRSIELSKNTFKDKKFIVLPATSIKDLQNESSQQNNCVRTYAEKYAEGICDIYFMRKVDKPKKSLVTVEVKNNKVVQSRIKNNALPTEQQLKFLKNWEQNVLKGVA
jgi:hypothetical protein